MQIREARAQDIEAMRAIYNASIPSRMATADTEPVREEHFRRTIERLDLERRPVLVAEIEPNTTNQPPEDVAGYVTPEGVANTADLGAGNTAGAAAGQVAGTVAGYLSVSDFYGRPAYHATAEIGVYVSPDHQRQGVGRALVSAAIERAPQLGLRKLIGFIFAHNEPSVRLFESLGFEPWGRLPEVAELDGQWCDVVILGRTVGDK